MTTLVAFSERAATRYREITGSDPEEAAGLRHLTTVHRNNCDEPLLVGVYNSAEAGLDDGDSEMNWSTVCELHAHVIGHATLKLAMWHASDVRGWCESCMQPDHAELEKALR